MQIAVLGGGNGSFAAAGDMALAGHEVRLWRRDAQAVAAHRAAGRHDHREGFHADGMRRCWRCVTADIAEAVRGAELILCPAPATAQADIAQGARAASDGRTGRVPAARHVRLVHFRQGRARRRQSRRCGLRRDRHAAVAHAQARAARGRHHHPGQAPADRRVSAARCKDHALAVIGEGFPRRDRGLRRRALGRADECRADHPSAADRHERRAARAFRRAGTSTRRARRLASRRVTDALDAERIAVREALGYGAPHFPLADHYAQARARSGCTAAARTTS